MKDSDNLQATNEVAVMNKLGYPLMGMFGVGLGIVFELMIHANVTVLGPLCGALLGLTAFKALKKLV